MMEPTTARDLIKPHMPVVCSEDEQFATVDHLEGGDAIKLTRDDSGEHHYIPLAWVTSVDDKVHIDRPGGQAMEEWSATPPVDTIGDAGGNSTENSTDQTRGQPLGSRVQARKGELERALAELGPRDGVVRTEIELAIATVNSLTTGDMDHPSEVVAAQLNNWLERNKYLAMSAERTDAAETGDGQAEGARGKSGNGRSTGKSS